MWQAGKLTLVFLKYTKIIIPLNWNNHKLGSKLYESRDNLSPFAFRLAPSILCGT